MASEIKSIAAVWVGVVWPSEGKYVHSHSYKHLHSLISHNAIIIFLCVFFAEPTLEGGSKHSEVGGVPLSQPRCSRWRAALLQHRIVRLSRDCLYTHFQQLLKGAAWKNPGLPLWHLRGQCPPSTAFPHFTYFYVFPLKDMLCSILWLTGIVSLYRPQS